MNDVVHPMFQVRPVSGSAIIRQTILGLKEFEQTIEFFVIDGCQKLRPGVFKMLPSASRFESQSAAVGGALQNHTFCIKVGDARAYLELLFGKSTRSGAAFSFASSFLMRRVLTLPASRG